MTVFYGISNLRKKHHPDRVSKAFLVSLLKEAKQFFSSKEDTAPITV